MLTFIISKSAHSGCQKIVKHALCNFPEPKVMSSDGILPAVQKSKAIQFIIMCGSSCGAVSWCADLLLYFHS